MTKRTFRFRRFAWLGASLLVGCGGARPRNVSGDGSGEGPLRATADATTSEVVLGVEAAGAEHPRAGGKADVHAVSVDALVVEALSDHPLLERARHEASAGWEVPSQVGALPDPVFSVAAQNIRFDEPGLSTSAMSAIQFGLLQGVPYPGKLAARRDVAKAAAVAQDVRVQALEAQVALNVRRAYWRLSYAEAAVTITKQNERVLNMLTNAVIARFSVAQAAQQDTLQAQTAHSRLRARLRRRQQRVVSARRVLNRAVGRPEHIAIGPVAPPPEEIGDDLSRKALRQALGTHNPDLALGRANVRTASAATEAAEQDRWPDFFAGVSYRLRLATPGDMTQGADMFGVTLGVTLPVWMSWKQNARVRQTRAQRRAADDALVDAELAVSTALATAIDEVERLNREIELYVKEVVPQADAALNASIEDYTFAEVGFVSLLQNWQMELDAQLMLARLRTDRAERLAEIDALVRGAQ